MHETENMGDKEEWEFLKRFGDFFSPEHRYWSDIARPFQLGFGSMTIMCYNSLL